MIIDITFERGNVSDIVLKPDGQEKAEILHDHACLLKVKNPALEFARRTKEGEFDEVSDNDFESMLCMVKSVSRTCFDNEPEINIFQLVVNLLKQVVK